MQLSMDAFLTPMKTPNQSMKPTAPLRNKFSVFATTPCRGLSRFGQIDVTNFREVYAGSLHQRDEMDKDSLDTTNIRF